MVEGSDQLIALLSIHPRYAEAIMCGEKRVEFRRRGPSSATTHVIVYATAPVSKVVGWFSVDSVESGSPAKLWSRYSRVGGIDEQSFNSYYEACAVGSAIRVGQAKQLESPVELASLGDGLRAPQSFRYVEDNVLASLSRARGGHSHRGPRRPDAPRADEAKGGN